MSSIPKPILSWLLQPSNPSVRYFTLTDLHGKPPDHPDVLEAKAQIMETGPVPKILAKQEPGGHWGKPEDFYIRSKYKGTVWSFLLLAQLGADGSDPRLRKAGEFIMEWSHHNESGGFAYREKKSGGGMASAVIPCLSGNMLFSLIRFGWLDDPRVQKGIDWITTYMRYDDGDGKPPKEWPYRFEDCWGRHTCTMGIVKALKALAEIPENKRNAAVNDSIANGAEFMLKHHLYRRSSDTTKIGKPLWTKLRFPYMYNTDALEMLEILMQLGYRDERMNHAVELVRSKQGDDGKWTLEKNYNGRYATAIERQKQPSRWITLRALRVLRQWDGE